MKKSLSLKSKILRLFLVTNFILLCFAMSYAVTKTSTGTGNWNTSGTWSPAGVPASGDDVVVVANHTVTVDIATAVCNTLSVAPTSSNLATLSFSSGSKLTVAGIVTLGDPGNTNRNGRIIMTSGGTLNCAGFALGNAGTNTFTAGTGTVELTAGNTLPSTVFTDFYNLSILGGNTTLSAITKVKNILTLSSGLINSTASNILSLSTGATTTVGNSASYVNGPMICFVTALNKTLNFPVGKGSDWRPAVLTVNHTLKNYEYSYTAEVFNADASALGWALPPTVDKVSTVHYWDIARSLSVHGLDTSSGNRPVVTLYYGTNDGVTDASNLTICKNKAGAVWFDIGGTGASVGTGSVSSTGTPSLFGSFSRFTLGNRDGGSNPLPVKLVSFKANCNFAITNLEWTTATETNNDYFTVESSLDGLTWDIVKNVKGAGNSYQLLNYSCQLPVLAEQLSFFRLKQTDFDGKYEYSDVIVAKNCNNDLNEDVIEVYPNPGHGVLNLQFNGLKESIQSIEVYNTMGKLVYSSPVYLSEIDLSGLPTGVYSVNFTQNSQTVVKRVIID